MRIGWLAIARLVSLVAIALPLTAQPAAADDNLCGTDVNNLTWCYVHWHSQSATYQIDYNMYQPYTNAIVAAAPTWGSTPFQLYQGTQFPMDGLTWIDTNTHVVWEDFIPLDWQLNGVCVSVYTIACTFVQFYVGVPNHLFDADEVLNVVYDPQFDTSGLACDPILGPAWIDIQSIALHEFGHWGYLDHTKTDTNAVMWSDYSGCRRNLTSHDSQSMNTLYSGPH